MIGKEMLAYAAGFFDGEGSVYIGWNRHSGVRHFHDTLKINVTQTSPTALGLLQQLWGGTLSGPHSTGGRRPSWQWLLSARKAETFLTDIRPYVVEKATQVWLALEYRAQCFVRHVSRYYPRTAEELALRWGFRQALKQAKGVEQ